MTAPYLSETDYEAEYTITDSDGTAVDLSGTDVSVTYLVTTREGGGETLLEKTEADVGLVVEPNGDTGVVRVELDADEVTWTGTVFEELRIETNQINEVPIQRSVRFGATASDP